MSVKLFFFYPSDQLWMQIMRTRDISASNNETASFLGTENELWLSSIPMKTCYHLQNIDDYITTTNFDFWQLTKPITERFMLSRISTVYVLWSGFFQSDKRRFLYSFELYKYQGEMADCHVCRSASNNKVSKSPKFQTGVF